MERRRICILSLTPIADDPRVRRQGEALHQAGWQVTAIGLPGAISVSPEFEIVEIGPTRTMPGQTNPKDQQPHLGPALKWREKLHTWLLRTQPIRHQYYTQYPVLRKLVSTGLSTWTMVIRYAWVSLSKGKTILSLLKNTKLNYAELIHFVFRPTTTQGKSYSWMMRVLIYYLSENQPVLKNFYAAGKPLSVDIVLANDWYMLPIAMRLSYEKGYPIAYDTHEYALEEYRYKWRWRFTRRPLIYLLERQAMRHAHVISTVSKGIADGMKRDYGTSRTIHSIPNTPPRESVVFRPCGDIIHVLYHGIIAPDRGLEACIQSVQYWRKEFVFDLRGPFASPEFEDILKQKVHLFGVGDRVRFLPKVPMRDMVRSASTADIGISTPPKTSKHNIYALPNKFFEYIQAGLALAVCDLPDMATYVRAHDMGILIADVSPEAIAMAINTLTPERIDYYKQQSLKASEILNWQSQQHHMVALYNDACDGKV